MHADIDLANGQETALQGVINLAYMCNYDPEHANRIADLSLQVFDLLNDLHHLGQEERFWLQCASILHDIGMIEGKRNHHKASLRIILNAKLLPFDNRERMIVGSIARYHRKALPDLSHDHYAGLNPRDRQLVNKLAALLRLSSGLTPLYHGVCDLRVEIKPRKLHMVCAVEGPLSDGKKDLPQADLFEKVYTRKLVLQWEPKTAGWI